MILTITELMEIAALSFLAVYAWGSPLRYNAVWSVCGMALFLGVCHWSLGVWGQSPLALVPVAVGSTIFALSHFAFHYDESGAAIGICFCGITLISGLGMRGDLQIITDQGPHFGVWTAITILLWLSFGICGRAIYYAYRNITFNR